MLGKRRNVIRLGLSMAEQSARKLFYKIGEVCQMTDTQPYVLRFWESEFSQLAPTKSRSGQRLYRRKDVDLVKEIKRLLYEEGYTIAGVRQKLGMPDSQEVLDELFEPPGPMPAPPRREPTPGSPRTQAAPKVTAGLEEILRLMDETDRRLKNRRDLPPK
jgi:DNA-binding transcriptional MerR regulator